MPATQVACALPMWPLACPGLATILARLGPGSAPAPLWAPWPRSWRRGSRKSTAKRTIRNGRGFWSWASRRSVLVRWPPETWGRDLAGPKRVGCLSVPEVLQEAGSSSLSAKAQPCPRGQRQGLCCLLVLEGIFSIWYVLFCFHFWRVLEGRVGCGHKTVFRSQSFLKLCCDPSVVPRRDSGEKKTAPGI